MIEKLGEILNGIEFNGERVPVDYLFNDSKDDTYIVYRINREEPLLAAGNESKGALYVSVDIFTRGNNKTLISDVKRRMKENFFIYQSSESSPDIYEFDTGYYHRCLTFAIYN